MGRHLMFVVCGRVCCNTDQINDADSRIAQLYSIDIKIDPSQLRLLGSFATKRVDSPMAAPSHGIRSTYPFKKRREISELGPRFM